MNARQFLARLLDEESGQGMAEYAIVVGAIFGILVGASFAFFPDFLRALQRYYDSYYIMLNLPIP